MGNVIAPAGLTPDKTKVQAIAAMPDPVDRTALQRLLGMVKYLAQCVPNESEIAAPLHTLLRKDVQWQWGGRAHTKPRDDQGGSS